MVTCEIGLLGGFGVSFGGRPLPAEVWRHKRATELVKILALSPGHRIHREQLMDLLWPDMEAQAAGANLRKALHLARQTFGSDAAIEGAGEMLVLFPSGDVTVDAEEFEASADAAISSGDPSRCEKAAALYHGDLLPEDRYATWAEEARERVRLRLIDVLKVGQLWSRVLDVDPLDEEAHVALMRDAVASGDRQRAIRQFERMRERFRIDLGLGPGRESIALYEEALAMEGAEPPRVEERVRALLAWGLVHLNGGDVAEAERTALKARGWAVEAQLGKEIGEASALLGMAANRQGKWKDLFRTEFIGTVGRTDDMASFVFDAHLCLAEFCLCGPAGHEDVGIYAQELLEVAQNASSVHGVALASLILGEAELFSGRLERAEELLLSSERSHDQAGASGGRALATGRLAEVALARGKIEDARELVGRARGLATATALEPHVFVRALGLEVELADDQVRAVDLGEEALGGRDVCMPCSMGFKVESAKALARAGEIVEGRLRLAEVERLAGMWQGGPWLGAVWETRAMVRHAEGEDTQAAALYKEAADLFKSFNRPRDEARCRAAATA